MSDGESLRQAVFNTPWDDALRLVYADWLMENGDAAQRALGEFLRVSTRMEQNRARELMDEYSRLMTANKAEWLRHLPEPLRKGPNIDFRGGFLREVRLPVADLLAHGPDLVRHYPIDSVGLTTFPTINEANDLVAAPLRWDRIRTLGFCGPFRPPSSATTILSGAGLVNLIHLRLSTLRISVKLNRIDAKAIRLLTEWPGLTRLRSLTIERTEIVPDAAATLFRLPALASVGELVLHTTGLDDAAARALLKSPFADGQGKVSLACNRFSEPIKSQLRQRFGERLSLD